MPASGRLSIQCSSPSWPTWSGRKTFRPAMPTKSPTVRLLLDSRLWVDRGCRARCPTSSSIRAPRKCRICRIASNYKIPVTVWGGGWAPGRAHRCTADRSTPKAQPDHRDRPHSLTVTVETGIIMQHLEWALGERVRHDARAASQLQPWAAFGPPRHGRCRPSTARLKTWSCRSRSLPDAPRGQHAGRAARPAPTHAVVPRPKARWA